MKKMEPLSSDVTSSPNQTQALLEGFQNAPGKADLHTHTVVSDGRESILSLCRAAKAAGVTHLGITDHDNLLSKADAEYYSLACGLDVIPGVELNCSHVVQGQRVVGHIGIHWPPEEDPEFQKILRYNQSQKREAYVKKMLANLYELGIDPSGQGVEASYAEIQRCNPESRYLGKGAVSQLLVDHGYCKDRLEASHKYLSRTGERLAFVPAEDFFQFADLQWVMETVTRYNETAEKRALLTLNHPYYYGLEPEAREQLVKEFAHMGGHCLEAYYPTHTKDRIPVVLGYCETYHLTPTGGSDRHHTGQSFLPIDEALFAHVLALR